MTDTDTRTIGTEDLVHVIPDDDTVIVHTETADGDCPARISRRQAVQLARALLEAAGD